MEKNADQKVGNWGKWGLQDERGALNYITPDAILKATHLVKEGKVYSLSLPLQRHNVPCLAEAERGRPLHFMRLDGGDWAAGAKKIAGMQFSDDFIFLPTHATTHIDALCHVWFDDKLYNGFDGNTVRSYGARYCGADKIGWIVTRGVLLDVARYKSVDALPRDYVITPNDLDNCARTQDVKLESGDVLLIRTGWMGRYLTNPEDWGDAQPGIGEAVIPWIISKEICVVGADNAAVEVWPTPEITKFTPVHAQLIRNYGVYIMELLMLDQMASDEVWEFLFIAAPLKISGGTASPLNPLAIT